MASHRKVFIRTDANPIIAGGHVMRCLSVADALSELGAGVEFVLSDGTPSKIIEERGYHAVVLGTDWRDIEEGASVLCDLCDAEANAVVLVDTYSITREYVDRLAVHAPVCYLGSKGGDLGSLALIANYSTDIDEAFYGETYGHRGTSLLLGANYAPLRPCFSEVYRERSGKVSRVLVTTGNTDPQGFLPTFLRVVLANPVLNGMSFSAVVGRMAPEEVVAEVGEIGATNPRIEVLRGVSDMAGLMSRCDVAVTANGTTVYELAASGVPAITFAMVEEQVQSAESLACLGATEYCGLLAASVEDVAESCVRALAGLVAEPARAAEMTRRAHGLIDGRGAGKIAKEIASL